jgi:peptidoglycan hydrolase-like protein with peptidoglycan-binding domain
MQYRSVAVVARSAGLVLVACVLALIGVEPAAAADSPARAAELFISSASWHGRAIREPHRHDAVRTSVAQRRVRGWSAGPVSFGTGFRRPGGSLRVREVQQRLRRLGYRPGPVDGLFGRQTRAAVAWFQVKHGLPVDGRATLATVRHLRARTGAGGGERQAGGERRADRNRRSSTQAGMARSAPWDAFRQLVGQRPAVADGSGAREQTPWGRIAALTLAAVVLLSIAGALLISAPTAVVDRAGREPDPEPDPEREPQALALPALAPDDRLPVGVTNQRAAADQEQRDD